MSIVPIELLRMALDNLDNYTGYLVNPSLMFRRKYHLGKLSIEHYVQFMKLFYSIHYLFIEATNCTSTYREIKRTRKVFTLHGSRKLRVIIKPRTALENRIRRQYQDINNMLY